MHAVGEGETWDRSTAVFGREREVDDQRPHWPVRLRAVGLAQSHRVCAAGPPQRRRGNFQPFWRSL